MSQPINMETPAPVTDSAPATEAAPQRPDRMGLPRWVVAAAFVGVMATACLTAGSGVDAAYLHKQAEHQAQIIIQQTRDQHAASFGKFGCSALVVADPISHVPEGAVTAEHCGLYNHAQLPAQGAAHGTAWIKGGDGKTYLVEPGDGAKVFTGSVSNHMQPVGDISEVLVQSDGANDIALLVFKGHSKEKVLADYNAEQLSNAALHNLVPDQSEIYISGWPAKRNGDGNGNFERQDFTALYLGTTEVPTVAGVNREVLLAVFPVTADGATCTPGISGAGGFVVQLNGANAETKLVGVLSAGLWYDPTDIPQSFKDEHPTVDWSKYSGSVCGFTMQPLESDNLTELHVVPNTAAIPNPQIDSVLCAESLFFDQQYQATVIDGEVIATRSAQVDGIDTHVTTAYENPVIFVNNDGTVVVGYYDPANGGFNAAFYDSLNDLKIYGGANAATPDLVKTHTSTFVDTTQTDPTYGSFQDEGGYNFGMRFKDASAATPAPSTQAYQLIRDADGKLSLVAK